MSILRWAKFFNKGLDKDEDKKEGLSKRLKNIEDKNEEQLKTIKSETGNNRRGHWFCQWSFKFRNEGVNWKIRVIQKDIDCTKFKIRGGNNVDYDFSSYKKFKRVI